MTEEGFEANFAATEMLAIRDRRFVAGDCGDDERLSRYV